MNAAKDKGRSIKCTSTYKRYRWFFVQQTAKEHGAKVAERACPYMLHKHLFVLFTSLFVASLCAYTDTVFAIRYLYDDHLNDLLVSKESRTL